MLYIHIEVKCQRRLLEKYIVKHLQQFINLCYKCKKGIVWKFQITPVLSKSMLKVKFTKQETAHILEACNMIVLLYSLAIMSKHKCTLQYVQDVYNYFFPRMQCICQWQQSIAVSRVGQEIRTALLRNILFHSVFLPIILY